MRRIFHSFLVLALLASAACSDAYDDSELRKSINSLEQRVAALETVMKAYENNLFIKTVETTQDGYIITFSDGSKATIINGKGSADNDGTHIESITIGENEVTFVLSDGQSFSIPLYSALSIAFEADDLVVMAPDATRDLRYTIRSVSPAIEIEAIGSGDIRAKVVRDEKSDLTGVVRITTGAAIDEYSKVVVLVSNGEKVVMKSISFEQAGLQVADNTQKEIPAEGGELLLEFFSNVPCKATIPDQARAWITAKETRAMEKQTLRYAVAGNTGAARSADIVVKAAEGDLSVTFTVSQPAGAEYTLQIEREALIAFYNATDGDNWKNNTNWCSSKPVSEWYGVEGTGGVTALSLFGNNLTGYIPEEFCNLLNIVRVELRENNLSGTIPAGFEKLEKLAQFQLDASNFSDVSPLFNLPNIWLLSLTLPGDKIPAEIGNLLTLKELYLYGERIKGSIPDEIGNLVNLEWLTIFAPQLTGQIPGSIGNCTNLKNLELSECSLTGSIPEELGNCSKLDYLNLSKNDLAGNIPEALARLANLREIHLDNNRLSGSLPSALGSSATLEYLYVFYNQLSGDIPASVQQNEELWKYCWAYILEGNNFNSDSYQVEGPDFQVTDLNGSSINSAQTYAKNRYTVLWQFSPYFSDFAGVDALISVYNNYKDKGVDIIGYCNVSTDMGLADTETSVKDFVKSRHIPWHTVLWTQHGNWLLKPKVGFLSYSVYYPFHSYPATTVIDRNGKMAFYSFALPGQESELATFLAKNIDGAGSDLYESADYSKDGEVTVLQRATAGKGIDLVLMGDGYSDRQIAAGEYAEAMNFAAEKLFTEEPYKSFRNLFNVYAVTAVSKNEGFTEYGQTALGGYFGDGTLVGGKDGTCFSYAQKAISASRMDDALIVVMMNSANYAGTCYMYNPTSATDYGSGVSVAYFPTGSDATMFEQLLHHEACGHGFAKLDDEYAYKFMGEAPASYIAERRTMEPRGWWKNIDFTGDPSRVKWHAFLTDPRYAYDGLGVFEGGSTYWAGVWRPTENSIMHHNTGGFNAPSREAIYYRIHKLAHGDGWVYNYEDFAAYDAVNRKAAAAEGVPYRITATPPAGFEPLHAPVVVGRSWREAMNAAR